MTGHRRVEEVMGTVFSVVVRGPCSAAALDEAFAWFHWVDEVFSPYRPDSAVSRLGRDEHGLVDCPPQVAEVLDRCQEIGRRTGGYFDVGADPRWPLDPSGYVKGWAAEEASRRLTAAGASEHCINAGGDVRVAGGAGGRPWRVGISHPLRVGKVAVLVELATGAVATSGTAERGFHVWDPHRRRPALDLASVTIVGPDLGLADAYATAALAMGASAPHWLAGLQGYEAYLIDAAGGAWWTPGFAELATGLPVAAPAGA